MVVQPCNMASTPEDQDSTWVLEGEGMPIGKRRLQVNKYDVSPNPKSTGIIYGQAFPDLGSKPTHTQCSSPTVDEVLHHARAPDPNPTPDPKVESTESTATGLTFSATRDVSSDPQPPTPAEDSTQLPPLTRANLGPSGAARLSKDIPAWINGESTWLCVAAHGGQAGVVPFGISISSHSISDSRDLGFTPSQPASFGHDALEIGAQFPDLAHPLPYSRELELN